MYDLLISAITFILFVKIFRDRAKISVLEKELKFTKSQVIFLLDENVNFEKKTEKLSKINKNWEMNYQKDIQELEEKIYDLNSEIKRLNSEIRVLEDELNDYDSETEPDSETEFKRTACGYVYFIHETGNMEAFKIGYTKNQPKKRASSLQTGNWRQLEVYDYILCPNYSKFEKFLHDCFQTQKIHGEWFRINEASVKSLISHLKGN